MAEVRLEVGWASHIFLETPMITKLITNTIVPESERLAFVDKLFGISYVIKLEPTVFTMAERIAPEYSGAYWTFHSLGNGGFYMAPRSDDIYDVSCENGFEGKLSASGLGIASCLYAYSHLSFGGDAFADVCATQYHLLREFAFQVPEALDIMRAID